MCLALSLGHSAASAQPVVPKGSELLKIPFRSERQQTRAIDTSGEGVVSSATGGLLSRRTSEKSNCFQLAAVETPQLYPLRFDRRGRSAWRWMPPCATLRRKPNSIRPALLEQLLSRVPWSMFFFEVKGTLVWVGSKRNQKSL